MRKHLLVVLAGVLLAAYSVAQGPRGGGFGPQSPYTLVTRKDVGKELKLTEDQASKLRLAEHDMGQQMRQAFQDNQGDFEAIGKARIKLSDAFAATVKSTISADQLQRLLQIYIQRAGNMAVTDADVQKLLKLTDAQSKQIKDLQDKMNAANGELVKKMMNGEMDRQDVFPAIQKNNEALKTEIEKLLSDDDKANIKKSGGDEFKFDPDEQFGGFGRPPGGGGGGGGGGN